MTIVEMRRHNALVSERAARRITDLVAKIQEQSLPKAMEEIGKEAADYAKATHTYINDSGALERSTTFAVIPPRSVGQFEYESPQGRDSFQVENDKNEVLLVIGAGMPYAIFVELKHGFEVVVQSFTKLRREFAQNMRGKLKSSRIPLRNGY